MLLPTTCAVSAPVPGLVAYPVHLRQVLSNVKVLYDSDLLAKSPDIVRQCLSIWLGSAPVAALSSQNDQGESETFRDLGASVDLKNVHHSYDRLTAHYNRLQRQARTDFNPTGDPFTYLGIRVEGGALGSDVKEVKSIFGGGWRYSQQPWNNGHDARQEVTILYGKRIVGPLGAYEHTKGKSLAIGFDLKSWSMIELSLVESILQTHLLKAAAFPEPR